MGRVAKISLTKEVGRIMITGAEVLNHVLRAIWMPWD